MSTLTYVTNVDRTKHKVGRGRIQIVDGPDAPRELAVPASGLDIGVGEDCALRLTDKRVSRNHAHIMLEANGFHVRDLGSTNGTFLAGVRIDDAVVPIGATIVLGKTSLKLLGPEVYAQVPASEKKSFGGLLGASLAMREVFGVLERVVGSNASILIEGETGTGKEVVARAVHSESARKKGPFVAIDCGAIAPNLIESELFGHVRGAFTGAVETRAGAFERAHGGTLFLDELGELSSDLQPKLLRVLESREIRKVGSDEVRAVDVRVVAATNRNLQALVDDGTFRADLFYRLAVVHLVLPALRDRQDDLPLLVEKFLRDGGVKDIGPIDGVNLALLRSHDWPGNVRELRNVLERAVACAGTAPTTFANLVLHLRTRADRPQRSARAEIDLDVPFVAAKEQVVDSFERAYLTQLLAATSDNVAEASRKSGLNRRHLYDLLKKHGLRA